MWCRVIPYCVNCGKELSSESSFCPNCGTLISAVASPRIVASRLALAEGGDFADLSQRIVAAIIDAILMGVVVGILAVFLLLPSMGTVDLHRWGAMTFPLAWMSMPWMWIPALIPLGYYIYFEGTRGQTIGKVAMHIKVIKTDGSPCDLVSAFLRNILRFVDNLVVGLVGIVAIAITQRRQRIGDIVANTVVVKA